LIRCDLLVVYSAFEPLSWHNGRWKWPLW
jgi:hypothetical protein